MESLKKEILLVDDHAGIGLGVSTYLKKQLSNIIAHYFTSGLEAYKQIEKQKPDIYIVDIELRDIGGMELIKMIKDIDKEAKIIIYTQHQGVWDIINFQQAGVQGIVIKGPDLQPLKEAVQALLDGKKYLCEHFRQLSIPNNEWNADSHLLDEKISLRDSEIEIIQLLAKGLDFKEIAAKTHYAEKSIPKIKDRLFKKFTVNSVQELITKMSTNGFPVKEEIKQKKGY